MDKLKQLIEEYQRDAADLTNKERAIREKAMWALVAPAERKNYGTQSNWCQSELGVQNIRAEHRLTLLNYGAEIESDLLWQRVDAATEAIPLSTAIRIMRRAKERAKVERCSDQDALRKELYAFDRGTLVEVDHRTSTRRTKEDSAPPPAAVVPIAEGKGWIVIKSAIKAILDEKLADLPELDRIQVEKSMEAELKATVDNLQDRIYRIRTRHLKKNEVTWAQVLRAHHVLHLDPPTRRNKGIDLPAIKKQYRKMVHLYHPDTAKDNSNAAKYQEVVDAYRLIQSFIEQGYGNDA